MSCPVCTDDPFANFSAEDPDSDIFRSRVSFINRPPLGWEYSQTGCLSVCYSDISQEDADDCARRQAEICLWHDWVPPCPVPPCDPATIFENTAQTCTVECPGNNAPFAYTVPAGTVLALTQAEANALAHSLACKRARELRPCIVNDPPDGCVGSAYSFVATALGGNGPYTYALVAGTLPTGTTMTAASGVISGTPTTAGSFMFQIRATDSDGISTFAIFTVCVVEIENPASLPAGNLNAVYSEQLTQDGAATAIWEKTSGTLPPGVTISEAGLITGIPTALGTYTFTIRLTHTCA